MVSVRSGTTDVSQLREIEGGMYRARSHFGRCLCEGAKWMTCLDLGGNVGLASRFLKQEYGDRIKQHIAVEPIKENVVFFAKNNPKVDLRAACIAKDARAKTITMAIPSSGYQWYRCANVEYFQGKRYEERTVPALPFLHLLAEVDGQCDTLLLKVDCEGPEIWIPEALAKFLCTKKRSTFDQLRTVILLGELSLDNHPTLTKRQFYEFGAQLQGLESWVLVVKNVGKPPPKLTDKGYEKECINSAVRFEFVLVRQMLD